MATPEENRTELLDIATKFLESKEVYLDLEPSIILRGGYYADLRELLADFGEHIQ